MDYLGAKAEPIDDIYYRCGGLDVICDRSLMVGIFVASSGGLHDARMNPKCLRRCAPHEQDPCGFGGAVPAWCLSIGATMTQTGRDCCEP